MASDPVLFEDIFTVNEKDPQGKKFDRVSRFVCKSELYEMDLTLDINIDVFPMKPGERFTMLLTKSLRTDGWVPEAGKQAAYDMSSPLVGRVDHIMDQYDYIMFGKIYRYKDVPAKAGEGGRTAAHVQVFISFGGLLMLLQGDPKKLEIMEVDDQVYLCIKKLG